MAYQSLLRSTRQQYHQHIAQVLEQRFPDIAATQPELLAHHYTEAGLHTQAIPYWHKAGLRASERSAYVEALAHLTAGLSLLPLLPATPARTQQELVLQLAMGPVLAATKGNAAPEVGQVYTRARALVPGNRRYPPSLSSACGLVAVCADSGRVPAGPRAGLTAA